MSKKILSILLTLTIFLGVIAVIPVSAEETEIADTGADVDVAETGNPYPQYNYYNSASDYQISCTWYAWEYAKNSGRPLPDVNWGNAGSWYGNASNKGSSPAAGSIACWSLTNSPPYGHVAYVTGVNSDGSINIVEGGSNWPQANAQGICSRTISKGQYWPDLGFIYLDGGNNEPDYTSENILSGVYVIHSAWDDNIVLDIAGDSKENDANIQLYERVTTNDVQKFRIIRYNDYYCIKSVYSDLWLDVKLPIGDNSNVKLYYDNSNEENDWQFIDAGDGYYYIRNRTGYYLDVQGDNAVNRANVQLYHFVGTNSQKWRLEDVTKYVNAGGVCKIRSAYNNNMCLDIAGNSKENRANIQLYESTNDDVQKFRIYKDGNFTCFKSVFSDKWLNISLPIECKANVQLWQYNDEEEQKWIFEDAGNGYVYIQSKTGFYLDLENDQAVNRANIQIYNFVGTNSQKWKIEDLTQHVMVEEGIYSIRSARNDNMCLDIEGNSTENRANIQLYQFEDTDIQKFYFKKFGDYYCIKSVYANKWLDIKTPFDNKSNVQLWSNNNSDEQYWVLEDAGNGYVYIRSKIGYYLDLEGDMAVNKANIQIYNYVGTNSQKWRLDSCIKPTEPTELPITPTEPPAEPPTNPAEQPTTPTEPKTIILGEVDGDDEVTIIDATLIQRKLVEMPVSTFNELAADVDGNEELEVVDATYIQRYLAEFPIPYPIGEWV